MATAPDITKNTLYAPAWQPGVSLLGIAFRGEPFGRHSHAGFAIGAIEAGIGGYNAHGARQLFPSGTLSLLNPEESHNGFALDGAPDGEDSAEDQQYRNARQLVAESQKASTSWLQRQMRIGYNSAARLIERMESLRSVTLTGLDCLNTRRTLKFLL